MSGDLLLTCADCGRELRLRARIKNSSSCADFPCRSGARGAVSQRSANKAQHASAEQTELKELPSRVPIASSKLQCRLNHEEIASFIARIVTRGKRKHERTNTSEELPLTARAMARGYSSVAEARSEYLPRLPIIDSRFVAIGYGGRFRLDESDRSRVLRQRLGGDRAFSSRMLKRYRCLGLAGIRFSWRNLRSTWLTHRFT
jgi:hypothetical protein